MSNYSNNRCFKQLIPSSKLQEIIAAITRKNGSKPRPTSNLTKSKVETRMKKAREKRLAN